MAAAATVRQHDDEALKHYEKALGLTEQLKDPTEWGALHNFIGMCHRNLGIRVEGSVAKNHLRSSVSAYREALKVYTREQLPQDWAKTQNNLG